MKTKLLLKAIGFGLLFGASITIINLATYTYHYLLLINGFVMSALSGVLYAIYTWMVDKA